MDTSEILLGLAGLVFGGGLTGLILVRRQGETMAVKSLRDSLEGLRAEHNALRADHEDLLEEHRIAVRRIDYLEDLLKRAGVPFNGPRSIPGVAE